MFAQASKTIGRMFKLSRFSQAGVTVATAAASAAVLYAVYPPGVAFAVLFVVAAHELGHFTIASRFTKAAYPVFVPLVFALVGITLVQPTDDLARMVEVYRAGPVWGIFASAMLLVISLGIAGWYMVPCALSLAFWEVYAISFGGDSRRIRTARSSLEETKALLGR